MLKVGGYMSKIMMLCTIFNDPRKRNLILLFKLISEINIKINHILTICF